MLTQRRATDMVHSKNVMYHDHQFINLADNYSQTHSPEAGKDIMTDMQTHHLHAELSMNLLCTKFIQLQ
jgi:hypothetical protein